jgi:hypothetical protein
MTYNIQVTGNRTVTVDHVAELVPLDAGRTWQVTFDGDIIVDEARNPETAAAVVLAGRGLSGRLAFLHQRGTLGLVIDIARTAAAAAKAPSDEGVE